MITRISGYSPANPKLSGFTKPAKRPIIQTPQADSLQLSRNTHKFSGHENITVAEAKQALERLREERATASTKHSSLIKQHDESVSEISSKERRLEDEVDDTKAKGVWAGAAAGAGAGAAKGATVDVATGGTLAGAGTAIGVVAGGIAGLIGGKAWAEKKTREKYAVPDHLYSKRDRLNSDKSIAFTRWNAIDDNVKARESEIEKAEKTLAGVQDTHRIAKTAVSVEPFSNHHFHDLHTALFAPQFLDDFNEGYETKKTAKKVPGFADRFQSLTKSDLGTRDAVPALMEDLRGDVESQKLGLRRLIGIEGNYLNKSKTVYPDFVKHPNEELASIALGIMTRHPELRPNQAAFNDTLVEILNSDKTELIEEALETIDTLKPQDRRIDISLNQLGHDKARLPELEDRKAVLALLGARKAQGLVAKTDAKSVSQQAIRGFVGNTAVESKLSTLVGNYYHTLENANHTGPALKVYLPGDAGIGKSLLVNRLQGALFGNPKQIITIRPDDIKPGNRLADILRKQAPANSTGEHDLDQRVIFFDEFQGLDTIKPVSERKKFLEDMKKLFAVNKTDVVAGQNWLRQEKLQMKHPVLAIAINGETKDLQAIRQTQEGKALQSRLMSMVVPNSAHRLDLNPDISKHIPEFIDNFGKERYFENVNDVRFDGPIHLTHRAKEAFLQKFSEMAEYMGSTQGRTLADMMVADINQAITDAESGRRFPFKRGNTANGTGLITDSLVVDASANGAISVKTGSLSQAESGSFLKQHQKGWLSGLTSFFTAPKAIEASPAESSVPHSGTVHTLSDSEGEEEANQQALVPYRPKHRFSMPGGWDFD